MACPFFFPGAKFDDPAFVIAPRLPLGAAHTGECRAGSAPLKLNESTLNRHCNAGYGRGACERFPAQAQVDAIRFHVADSKPSAVGVQYLFEKGCWPVGHGILHYSRAEGLFLQPHRDEIVQRQAQAFIERFLET